MNYYGFNSTQQNCGGLGALIHDIMMAAKYCQENNLTLCFVKEGYSIPRFNGSIPDDSIPDQSWHSYFTTIPIIKQEDCIGIWPYFLEDKKVNTTWSAEEYSILLSKILTLHVNVYENIHRIVSSTPFCSDTDIVVHIRQTEEKKLENKEFVSLDVFIRECEHALQVSNLTRIYICTDNVSVCQPIKKYFDTKNISVVWDDREPDTPLQYLRYNNLLNKKDAQKETINALKNLIIMKSSKYLIGGRMSYFFRIAELLGHPNTCVNIQDNDLFGISPYSDKSYRMRPYLNRTIPKFINPDLSYEKYIDEYQRTGIVSIPSVISPEHISSISKDLNEYSWWCYSTHTDTLHIENSDRMNNTRALSCLQKLEDKKFCYRFKRSHGEHYDTCLCISCRLTDTFKSFPVTDSLCKIIGCRHVVPNEIFISNYSENDFLSVHHDIKKGDIAVTCSLTEDWHVSWGGLLHFCNEQEIYKSISPSMGTLTIFKLDPDHGVDHFVSMVNVNKSRYTLTAWYTIDESLKNIE